MTARLTATRRDLRAATLAHRDVIDRMERAEAGGHRLRPSERERLVVSYIAARTALEIARVAYLDARRWLA